jgi:hypothetical protein
MLETFIGAAAGYLGRYSRLRSLVEPSDASIVDQLIAHELAFGCSLAASSPESMTARPSPPVRSAM